MDFLYRNIHMEQKKWEATTQITIEEDINVPDIKRDCASILLKDGVLLVEETRVGRDQVVVKGSLKYQILYMAGSELEALCGELPFEEIINVTGAIPGDFAVAKGVIEDFKVSMINTRKLAIQSVVMLYVTNHQQMEEEWTEDVINCGDGVQKKRVTRNVLQLAQKKTDIFRVKEEMDVPGGYPAVQAILWKRVSLGDFETRAMDGRISIKGELHCHMIYAGEGQNPTIKMLSKKVPFHGMLECSGCETDRSISVLPILRPYTIEVKQDLDGEDRILFLDAPIDLQIRVYCPEKVDLLEDVYSTQSEMLPEGKTIHTPLLYLAGEGKGKLKQNHKLKEGTPFVTKVLHTLGHIYPDREVWEENTLHMMGSVLVQMLYETSDEEVPYAVTECMMPYELKMESIIPEMDNAEHPSIFIEPRLEQIEAVQLDSREVEIRGIIAFSVLATGMKEEVCLGDVQIKPIDTAKYALIPSVVVCFAERDTPLWEYGKRYYMPVDDMKRLNNITSDVLKAGEKMMIVKGVAK